MMKIALFTENSYSGGLDVFMATLLNHWPVPDDEFVIFCNRGHPGLKVLAARVVRPIQIVAHDLPILGEILRALPQGVFARPIRAIVGAVLRYPLIVYYRRRIAAMLLREGPDRLMVINGGYPAGDTCRAAAMAWADVAGGRPLSVHNFHNIAVPVAGWNRHFENAVDRSVVRGTGAFVSVSKTCAASLERRPALRSAGGSRFIYNGIAEPDTVSEAQRHALRDELGIERSAPLALMLGSYEPRKGHDFLFRAFAMVLEDEPGARLIACGYGYPADVARVSARARELGIERAVHLLGFRDDVPVLMAAADLVVVASQAYESFGLTAVEAMALRRPVVTTDVGALPEIVGSGVGAYCVARDDVRGFAARMLQLFDDGDLRQRMGALGEARYRTMFTAGAMSRAYAGLLHSPEHTAHVSDS